MTMENKQVKMMTNKGALNYVLENCELPKEVEEKLIHMVEQLEKKSSSPRKETKTQIENKELCEIALETLINSQEKMTVTDVLKATPIFKEKELSTQKVSALLKILLEDNKIEKVVEKGKSYFCYKN